MKKFRFHLLLTALIALLSACGSDSDSPDKILPLPVPASLVSEGDEASLTFTWEAVPDAKCYAYRFNEGDEVYTNETSVRFDGLTPLDAIQLQGQGRFGRPRPLERLRLGFGNRHDGRAARASLRHHAR